jgi:nicotinate-nucleotide adenylyltransferase
MYMAKIGIMGGTFDPIHNGHLMLGRQALEEYGLDQVWYMPSGQPPHKKDHVVTDAADRLEMVRLAVDGIDGFVCSDFEIRRPGITYSVETLRLLRQEYPEDEFYFIIGADSFYEIEHWYQPQEILKLTALLVAGREYPGAGRTMKEQKTFLEEKYQACVHFLHCAEMDVSSSELRRSISGGGSVEGLVPEAVLSYIEEKGLYKAN